MILTLLECGGCKHVDKTEHDYPCCICTQLDLLRSDKYEPKEEG